MAADAAAPAQTIFNIQGFGTEGARVVGAQPISLPPGTLVSMVDPTKLSLAAGGYLLSDA